MTEPCAESIRVMHPLFQAGQGGSIPTSALSLWLERIDFRRAAAINHYWHSVMPRFGTGSVSVPEGRFACWAATFDGMIYAVAIWSAPAARRLPTNWLELRRLAIAPDAPRNTASRMLAIMTRLLRSTQTPRLISYQDTEHHTGCIYKAAGWTKANVSEGGEWNVPSRSRPKVQSAAPKVRWEKVLVNEVQDGIQEAESAGAKPDIPLC